MEEAVHNIQTTQNHLSTPLRPALHMLRRCFGRLLLLLLLVLSCMQVGTQVYFTIRSPPPPQIGGLPVVGVNYDSLGEDLEVGWLLPNT